MSSFTSLHREDVMRVLTSLPSGVLDILRNEPVVLAGGAIRDTVAGSEVKDVDIFCHDAVQAEALARSLAGPFLHITKTLNAYNVPALLNGPPVQFVFYRDYASPEDLIGQFDFRACQAAIYCDVFTGRLEGICAPGFYGDCKRKTLFFLAQDKDENSLVPLKRAMKLAGKGWRLPDGELAGILQHWDHGLQEDYLREALSTGPSYGGRR